MKKLLWVGDAGCPTGFAVNTHNVLETLRQHYDVTVLGINYRGDPHSYPYPIYAAQPGGDAFGVGRLIWMCDVVKPDVIIIQQDPWNFRPYLDKLHEFPEYASIPVIGVVAVDGLNCCGRELNDLALAIFWTKFGAEQARLGGYTGPSEIIPLGVDLQTFTPMDTREARRRRGLPPELDEAFIVGNVNRNQPRKRWDLTMRYFAQAKIPSSYLYLHVAPTGDTGTNVVALARYYGILEQLLLREPPTFYGDDVSVLRDTYNSFDVQVNTGQGEGFGLTTIEGMACGIPQVVGDWSALGDWPGNAVLTVPCTSTHIGPPYVNVIGGVPDEKRFVNALHNLHVNASLRENYRARGLALVQQERFRWSHIGEQFRLVMKRELAEQAA